MGNERLAAQDDNLSSLVRDLDEMERYLKTKIEHLNDLVGSVDNGWKSPAATAYKELQLTVNRDAVRIREMLILVEEAVKLSRDGFNAQDMEILHHFQQLQKSTTGQQKILAMANANPQPKQPAAGPRSALDDY
ncbi:hypothetical protein GCM10010218_43870 [Streptomyces mashuensis]|uniref:WXG100 family type VII secretion target n=1 Tax=Streptomyces mashuensis TaxID=33904 RepID=A0A919EEJ3_9ACTN|nr:hypothetical protein [Streptomyces mashuensis]GHF57682.1 hypothetical protein GCM10010218_43870 [Streptomyces mashuensis]